MAIIYELKMEKKSFQKQVPVFRPGQIDEFGGCSLK